MSLFSDRGECYLFIGDVDVVISDCIRVFCLFEFVNMYGKSFWIRLRVYDIKGFL